MALVKLPTSAQWHNNPWPPGDGPVVFILDRRNDFEAGLLSAWISRHQTEKRRCTVIELSLADDRLSPSNPRFERALAQTSDAVVVPLRLGYIHSSAQRHRPRLTDLLRGGEHLPGALRGRWIAARYPERLIPYRGLPASVAELAARFAHKYEQPAAAQPAEFGVFVARAAAVVLDMAERQQVGGRYKVPRYVAASLQSRPEFRAQLATIAAQSGQSPSAISAEVTGYLREMVSIPTRFWLDVWAKVCNICLGLGYDPALNYSREDVERIRGIVRKHPTALLWTHKTYIDGFVVPKILFDNDFPMPHLFGGANLNIPGLGFLLRRAGGIFIKRSFQDNEAYKTALRAYIGYLMEKHFPLSWSFEGTRSRLGKLMPPKYGLLKYVLEGAWQADARDIHIIPVSVSYDLVRDAEEYAREQAGVPKAPESIAWMISYLRSLARPMGKIYVNFGEPVKLAQAPDPSDRLALSKIAFEVAVEANRVTPITLPAAVSMALLGVYPRALTEQEVIFEVSRITQWADARAIRQSADLKPLSKDTMQAAQAMHAGLNLMIEEGIISRFDGGMETVYGIAPGQAPIASFYRNTIIHFFLNQAIAELALIAVMEIDLSVDGQQSPESTFWDAVDDLRDLFKFEFFYPPSAVFHDEIDCELQRLDSNWRERLNNDPGGARHLLGLLEQPVAHRVLQVFSEAYHLAAEVLCSVSETDRDAFIDRCMNYGRQAYLQRRISSEASMGKILFQNAWQVFDSRGLLDQDAVDCHERRRRTADVLERWVRRIEISRALSISQRGAETQRDRAIGVI